MTMKRYCVICNNPIKVEEPIAPGNDGDCHFICHTADITPVVMTEREGASYILWRVALATGYEPNEEDKTSAQAIARHFEGDAVQIERAAWYIVYYTGDVTVPSYVKLIEEYKTDNRMAVILRPRTRAANEATHAGSISRVRPHTEDFLNIWSKVREKQMIRFGFLPADQSER